jgi:hypothetical protein
LVSFTYGQSNNALNFAEQQEWVHPSPAQGLSSTQEEQSLAQNHPYFMYNTMML